MNDRKTTCRHEHFEATVEVNRLEDAGRFMADVRVQCSVCKTPFRFIGLPAGVDLNGAAVSADGEEARLAIAPRGDVVNVIEGGDVGFTVRKVT